MSDNETKIAESRKEDELRKMTVEIVSAFVSQNSLPADEVSDLVQNVFNALSGLGGQAEGVVATSRAPAVPVNRSLTRDGIVCLEDGKVFTSLKRHLNVAHNLTPEEYRIKWGLREDYPMVAPDYSDRRSDLAKQIGLGRKTKGGRKSGSEKEQAA